MTLPPEVADLCDRFLALAPAGLVEGLYLRGGLAFGEWVEGQSDVDFVAVLAHRPDAGETEQLRALHAELAASSPVPFDGLHVVAADLASDPRLLPDVPTVLHGWFDEGTLDAVVAWHELAERGVTVAGPPIACLDVWTDATVLRDVTRDNVATYWRDNADLLARMSVEAERPDACAWTVLGAARVHHLLVTGAMTSKSAAARWGLGFYDERWHRVLREALRVREGDAAGWPEQYAEDPAQRGRDVAGFLAHVVDAAG